MEDFDGLQLIGGDPALDFTNTVEYRREREPGDRLSSFESLARWAHRGGLLSSDELASVIANTSRRSSSGSRALQSAIELREAFFAMIVGHIRKAPLPKDAVGVVERQVKTARAAATLRYVSKVPSFSWHIPIRCAEDVTMRVADSVNNLLLSLDRVVVHQCNGPRCDWLFVDRSHGHRRVWCQPDKCGNVVRVRRFRTNK